MKPACLFVLVVLLVSGCSYMGTVTRQTAFALRQPVAPSQRVYKHMLERDTFFVFGEIDAGWSHRKDPLAVVAIAAGDSAEVVDVNQTSRHESFYGMNLPVGTFRLLLVADQNGDGFLSSDECLGEQRVELSLQNQPEKVLGGIDLKTGMLQQAVPKFRIKVVAPPELATSVFYPKGSIRSLDDPIFSPKMSNLGLYEPAAFLEAAPMMFYALEEDAGFKVPVIFVHGINGSAREFGDIVARLDRRYYRPWFFHYPSGVDLDQLSEMFYRIFLSGSVVKLSKMPAVIVAHSMGGLVVRDALNRYKGTDKETKVGCFITIASPLGGHPGAAAAAHAPVVIPSWRDLAPESDFIRGLHRRPLPKGTDYHLFYTFGNPGMVKMGKNSDGVVPIASQCVPWAQNEAVEQFGFDDTHAGVLRDPAAIERVVATIETVHSYFPDDHLAVLLQGGYPVPDDLSMTPLERYVVETIGLYMDALVEGRLQPVDEFQEHFVAACRGERRVNQDAEKAWLKYDRYRREHALDAAKTE